MELASIGNTLVNKMDITKEDSKVKPKNIQDNIFDELLAMVELSVKSTNLPDNIIGNIEAPALTKNITDEGMKILPLANGDFLNLSDIDKLKEIAKTIKLANNNNQLNNIGNNLILNINSKNKLFQEVDLDLIKKQNELLEKYGNADLKVDILEHPKVKLIRETTKDLIAQHREFLQPFKEKLGFGSNTNEQNEAINLETQTKIDEIKESNKLFFDGLKSKLESNQQTTINSNIVSNTLVNNDNKLDVNQLKSEKLEFVSPLKDNANSGGLKFGMENNNLTSGENSTKNSESLNSKKLIELFMNGKISSEAFNQNLSELKQISNEIKVNAKEYVIYKDVQAKNIMINTANSLSDIAPNGSAVIKMNLNPNNLGKVFVELNVINNVATLNFKSESKETIKLIENQINNLVEKLNTQGINTNSISVSLNSREEQEMYNQNKFFERNNKGQSQSNQNKDYLDTLKNLALLNEIKS